MLKLNVHYGLNKVGAGEQNEFFFENSLDLFCILDREGRIVRVNKSWDNVLGWGTDRLKGVELVQLVHPEDVDYFKQLLINASKGNVSNAECRLISRKGESLWFSWKSTLRADEGEIYVVIRDITYRKKTIQKLEEQSRRYFLATRATDTGIWDWLIHKNKMHYSASWKTQLGYEKDELEDSFETWQMLLHPDDYAMANAALSEYLENPTEIFEIEFRLRHKDGSYRWIHNRAASFIGKDGKPYRMLGTHRDITRQKEFENELKEARAKAETANIYKNNFIANMGHEIRTPMNGIVGFSELLKEPDLDQNDKNRYIKIINDNCNILLNLVDDIIDISKIEANEINLQKSQFSLNELMFELKEFYDTYKLQVFKEDISINIIPPEEICNDYIETDHLRLRQILTNLLGNALKFTHKGKIEFGYKIIDNKNILFSVKDTGIGIAQDKMEIIFRRFHQSDESLTRKYGGTGLGLSICQGLIKLLKGEIWVESEVNKGSSFYFTIPYKPVYYNSF